MLHKKQRLIILVGTTLLAAGIVGSGHVHAFNQHRADVDIDMIGSYAGDALLAQFLSPVENNWSARHTHDNYRPVWAIPQI